KTTSVLIVKSGKLVYEKYFGEGGRNVLNNTRSATKSITSLAIGAAIGDNSVAKRAGFCLPRRPATLPERHSCQGSAHQRGPPYHDLGARLQRGRRQQPRQRRQDAPGAELVALGRGSADDGRLPTRSDGPGAVAILHGRTGSPGPGPPA